MFSLLISIFLLFAISFVSARVSTERAGITTDFLIHALGVFHVIHTGHALEEQLGLGLIAEIIIMGVIVLIGFFFGNSAREAISLEAQS